MLTYKATVHITVEIENIPAKNTTAAVDKARQACQNIFAEFKYKDELSVGEIEVRSEVRREKK